MKNFKTGAHAVGKTRPFHHAIIILQLYQINKISLSCDLKDELLTFYLQRKNTALYQELLNYMYCSTCYLRLFHLRCSRFLYPLEILPVLKPIDSYKRKAGRLGVLTVRVAFIIRGKENNQFIRCSGDASRCLCVSALQQHQ